MCGPGQRNFFHSFLLFLFPGFPARPGFLPPPCFVLPTYHSLWDSRRFRLRCRAFLFFLLFFTLDHSICFLSLHAVVIVEGSSSSSNNNHHRVEFFEFSQIASLCGTHLRLVWSNLCVSHWCSSILYLSLWRNRGFPRLEEQADKEGASKRITKQKPQKVKLTSIPCPPRRRSPGSTSPRCTPSCP